MVMSLFCHLVTSSRNDPAALLLCMLCKATWWDSSSVKIGSVSSSRNSTPDSWKEFYGKYRRWDEMHIQKAFKEYLIINIEISLWTLESCCSSSVAYKDISSSSSAEVVFSSHVTARSSGVCRTLWRGLLHMKTDGLSDGSSFSTKDYPLTPLSPFSI